MGNIIKQCEEYFAALRVQGGDLMFFEELPDNPEPIAVPVTAAPSAQVAPLAESAKPVQAFAPIAASPKPAPEPPKPFVAAPVQAPAAPKPVSPAPVNSYIQFGAGKVDPTWKESQSLDELNTKICNCLNCPLGTTRSKFVFGKGNPNADLMIIGEAPGNDEDLQGEPFVGRAGQLLTKILEAINFSRDEVFIGNICKCRPPGNRRPTVTEVEQCEPYLIKQIELIKPRYILALGLTACDTLFKKPHKMGEIRGKMLSYNGIPTMVTYHPAALLRNPAWKKFVWEDVQALRAMYDESLKEQE